jgi:hypothetical protein
MKQMKDEISIENKLSANYLIHTLLKFQKRLVTNEHKQRKSNTKISKVMDDLYEPSVETSV